tara:strand:+ start:1048 stop:3420 length:2373 start_codon:yes stop_codon:yes gene_type:complete
MAESVYVNFPSQAVPDLEKMSPEYGLKVARAIEQEWFKDSHSNRYSTTQNKFHQLRLYARGEQSIQKYKDELSINGDLSYLNLDWKPVPIIPKFVDIVVNGMSERMFNIKAYSQDQYGVSKRTEYMESVMRDMKTKQFNDQAQTMFNMDLYENKKEDLPDTQEELDLHMQLNYKQAVEIAEEQAINVLLDGSGYDLTRRRLIYDLTVLGIGCVKTTFNWSEGAKVEYVDPTNIVYSYTESPYFEDIYYVGEVKTIPINELAREFDQLTESDLEEIYSRGSKRNLGRRVQEMDKNKVQVLYFNYKTHMNDVYKIKETGTGGIKAIEKPDTFNPPKGKEGGYERLQRSVECVFEGAMILGTDKLIKWNKAENMMRSKSDFNKVKMNYSLVAPRMYEGRIESLVSRITGFADMIQLTHLKLQQVMSRMVPDGVYLDADGLAEIDLGNGTNYTPQEALNMFFQTGSVIGRSLTSDGDPNPGKVPITQISNGQGAGNKLQALIGNYNYYLQMIRDVTGLNEARDASTPDAKSLVGIQKLAAANSNVATRHILMASSFLTTEVAEALSLRISDILEYSPTADAFVQAIGAHNVATLKEMSELHLYDFGIFLELEPDEEEKQMLENNIQTALAQQLIDLDDAIDIREIRNLKLANQLLKIKRKKKQERDQKIQQENAKAQADANAQAQQAIAQAEMQKNQAKAQADIQLESVRNEGRTKHLQEEVRLKKELMQFEFDLNESLRNQERQSTEKLETMKEAGKDKRENIKQAPKKFESSGNDILGGGMGLDKFTPQIGN